MLCGDVMTGRGIDQALPHPGDPVLHETWVKSATDYVAIAEKANGPIARPMVFDQIWGDALGVLDRLAPDLRIVNLETAVTTASRPWPKGINYRMSPENVGCLTAAGIDCCVLANNHVMDWGRDGLVETLRVLHGAGLTTAGAGNKFDEAAAPGILPVPGKGRVLVYGFAFPSSGVPDAWAATDTRPGVNVFGEPDEAAIEAITETVRRDRRPGDLVLCSLHWGPNWGYEIPSGDRAFAHRLIEIAGVDIVHGHSSHHRKAIEVHHGKPILYGCGDFLNDYEGIGNHEPYRGDLVFMYIVEVDAGGGQLAGLGLVPFRIRNFRLNHAESDEVAWLHRIMDRECRGFGGSIVADGEHGLLLLWR
jgi:poly-gamma-glutamate capsule biosynthesis protein CapA/YwtB (metallophosphatase superfamily)